MATWQFWTLTSLIGAIGLYGLAYLHLICTTLDRTNQFLVMLHDKTNDTCGAVVSVGIDVDAIKQRAQRD